MRHGLRCLYVVRGDKNLIMEFCILLDKRNTCIIVYFHLSFTNSICNRISEKECEECKRPHEHSKNKSRSHKKENEKKGKIPSTFSICSLLNSRRHCAALLPILGAALQICLPIVVHRGKWESLRICGANSALPGLNLGCRGRLLITPAARDAVEKQNACVFVGISFQWALLMLAVVHYSSSFFSPPLVSFDLRSVCEILRGSFWFLVCLIPTLSTRVLVSFWPSFRDQCGVREGKCVCVFYHDRARARAWLHASVAFACRRGYAWCAPVKWMVESRPRLHSRSRAPLSKDRLLEVPVICRFGSQLLCVAEQLVLCQGGLFGQGGVRHAGRTLCQRGGRVCCIAQWRVCVCACDGYSFI